MDPMEAINVLRVPLSRWNSVVCRRNMHACITQSGWSHELFSQRLCLDVMSLGRVLAYQSQWSNAAWKAQCLDESAIEMAHVTFGMTTFFCTQLRTIYCYRYLYQCCCLAQTTSAQILHVRVLSCRGYENKNTASGAQQHKSY